MSRADPSDLTVFNGEVLFNGVVSGSLHGLWVTDGTAGGTQELTDGGVTTGLGLNPSDFTVFKNNEALFSGVDASGKVGLWETNGTALGTQEIPVNGAASGGVSPSNLTVLGDFALFNGLDATGNGLWVTDGTTLNTHELTGITDINGNPVSDLNPRFLTAFNDEVLFNGVNSNGLQGLWETDGTNTGTHELLAAAPGADLRIGPVELRNLQRRSALQRPRRERQ